MTVGDGHPYRTAELADSLVVTCGDPVRQLVKWAREIPLGEWEPRRTDAWNYYRAEVGKVAFQIGRDRADGLFGPNAFGSCPAGKASLCVYVQRTGSDGGQFWEKMVTLSGGFSLRLLHRKIHKLNMLQSKCQTKKLSAAGTVQEIAELQGRPK
jgi:hypothetical protein